MDNPHFKFAASLAEHRRGDPRCPGCRWDLPAPCGCGGLVHVEYMDHRTQPFIYLCDRCPRR